LHFLKVPCCRTLLGLVPCAPLAPSRYMAHKVSPPFASARAAKRSHTSRGTVLLQVLRWEVPARRFVPRYAIGRNLAVCRRCAGPCLRGDSSVCPAAVHWLSFIEEVRCSRAGGVGGLDPASNQKFIGHVIGPMISSCQREGVPVARRSYPRQSTRGNDKAHNSTSPGSGRFYATATQDEDQCLRPAADAVRPSLFPFILAERLLTCCWSCNFGPGVWLVILLGHAVFLFDLGGGISVPGSGDGAGQNLWATWANGNARCPSLEF
jgi:hypothetical protein